MKTYICFKIRILQTIVELVCTNKFIAWVIIESKYKIISKHIQQINELRNTLRLPPLAFVSGKWVSRNKL